MRKSLVALGLLAALLSAGTAFAEQTAEPVVDLAALLAAPAPVEMAGPGVQCGNVVCGKGYQCCSSSCSLCGPAGGACPDIMCPFAPPPQDQAVLLTPQPLGE